MDRKRKNWVMVGDLQNKQQQQQLLDQTRRIVEHFLEAFCPDCDRPDDSSHLRDIIPIHKRAKRRVAAGDDLVFLDRMGLNASPIFMTSCHGEIESDRRAQEGLSGTTSFWSHLPK